MRQKLILAATILALAPLGAAAQPADAHHPADEAATKAAPQTPAAMNRPAQAGMAGGMNMMDMMPMMRMMAMMGSGDAPGMGMIDHVEGRIAYLRAELKITDAQANVWNGFAAALRTNAQALGAAHKMMMGGASQAATLSQRLDGQERWLAARLDGTRAIKTAFTRLYAALSPDQKKAADDMLAPHMGMAMPMMMPPMGGAAAH